MKRSGYIPKYPVQTVEKACDILLYLINKSSTDGTSLGELSEQLQMNKSTLFRILDTLLSYRMVEKSTTDQSYRPGWGLYEMGMSVPSSYNLRAIGDLAVLEQLCSRFSETVNFGIRSGDDVFILHKAEPECRLRANVQVGACEPMYATALGKLFLSEYRDDDVWEYFRHQQVRSYTHRTLIDADSMLRELAQIRRQDWAMDDCEFDPDLRCIACPVRDYTRRIVAAVSISGPATRMTEEARRPMLPALRAAAHELSLSWGYSPDAAMNARTMSEQD